ncbi:MAG: RNA polymerase sporulation sigma factor SigK [Clostridia bacterium]|nr:RNA polymerase sporulation sigma factor SigK [Clostridia bacterium]
MNIWLKLRKLFSKLFAFREKGEAVHFLCGAPLPLPMSAEEERDAVRRMHEGDESARQELVERNLRLVVYIAKKFEGSVPDMQDLVSIGSIGLMKAVNSFDPSKNIKLATFASRCIENEILMHLRKTSRRKCEVSLDEPLNVDWEGNELLLSDMIGTDCDAVSRKLEKRQEIEWLYQSMACLSSREITILKLRFGLMNCEEKTQKEIADMMGISQSYISRLEKKVLAKLRKEMAKYVD